MLLLCMFYCPLTKDEIRELLLLLLLLVVCALNDVCRLVINTYCIIRRIYIHSDVCM